MGLLRTKTVEQSIEDTDQEGSRLRRSLGSLDLVVLGVGVIIGTGIFVLTGKAAGTLAGPAIALSFVVAGIACGLAALCYAEFASTVPVAGSAYTFSYASLGELVAWIIGWDLILELALGAATVASGWSGYFVLVLHDTFGVTVPDWFVGAHHNLAAAAIVLILTALLCFGIKVSTRVNMVIVAVKVTVVLLVIVAGIFYIKTSNLSPFVPSSGSTPAAGGGGETSLLQDIGLGTGTFGVGGIFTGAALVFFAFIGFDVVATAAEETKKPQRDLPRGIFGSLIICTVLYVAVSLVVTGMVKYNKVEVDAPLAAAFKSVGQNAIAQIVSFGALAGLTTVILVLMLGQSRVFFAMSRDHLLPPVFSKVSPRTQTPYRTTLVTGVAVAALSALVSLDDLADLVNIGTLAAFILVSLGVIVLRRTRPDLERTFRTPGVPFVPILSALASFYLMLNLPGETWVRFGIWMLVGFVVYFGYSRRHSRLAHEDGDAPGPPDAPREERVPVAAATSS
jgi:APA family basic amino acid/polyamine antiporter